LENPVKYSEKETAALQGYFNEYLAKIGKLELEMQKDPTKFSEIDIKIKALKLEMSDKKRIAQFPTLREYFAIEHEVGALKSILEATSSPRSSTEMKKKVMAAWKCENSAVFAH